MDPNACLAEIRSMVASALRVADLAEPAPEILAELAEILAEILAEHVNALDVWITRGGYLPSAWQVTI
jgi:hypothetical protein